MTNRSIEVEATLRLALEALENTSPLGFNMESDKRFYAAITAIKAALEAHKALMSVPDGAQPEQEPIAKVCHDIEQHIGWNPNLNVAELPEGMPLYGSPQRKPLTYCPEWMTEEEQTAYTFGWFKALESQRIAQPEQKPVAIYQFRSPHCSDWYDGVPDHHDGHGPYETRTLYTHPPVPYVVEPRTAQPDCTRSHPHEEMSKECELRTEIARLTNELARLKEQPKPDLKPRCFADFQPNHEHDRKCQWCAVETECKTGMSQPKEPAVPQGHKQSTTCGEPVAWMPIEQMYPQAKAIDILMGDGSILCGVLPQFDGDLWWEGSGTGEKFIDPKYANVTHWRIHGEHTAQPQRTAEQSSRTLAWVGLTDEEKKEIYNAQRGFPDVCKAIEAKLKEKNTRNGGCL